MRSEVRGSRMVGQAGGRERRLFPGVQTGAAACDPVVWCDHLFVGLIWAGVA